MGRTRDALSGELERTAVEVALERGVEVVGFVFRSQGRHSVVRVDIDREGPAGVTLEDCEGFSRAFEPRLDLVEGLPESYDLQISSPGLDRPIVTDDDFRRNRGRRIELETSEPIENRRSWTGTLLASPGEVVRLLDGDREIEIPKNRILAARQELGLGGGPKPGKARREGRRGSRGIV